MLLRNELVDEFVIEVAWPGQEVFCPFHDSFFVDQREPKWEIKNKGDMATGNFGDLHSEVNQGHTRGGAIWQVKEAAIAYAQKVAKHAYPANVLAGQIAAPNDAKIKVRVIHRYIHRREELVYSL